MPDPVVPHAISDDDRLDSVCYGVLHALDRSRIQGSAALRSSPAGGAKTVYANLSLTALPSRSAQDNYLAIVGIMLY